MALSCCLSSVMSYLTTKLFLSPLCSGSLCPAISGWIILNQYIIFLYIHIYTGCLSKCKVTGELWADKGSYSFCCFMGGGSARTFWVTEKTVWWGTAEPLQKLIFHSFKKQKKITQKTKIKNRKRIWDIINRGFLYCRFKNKMCLLGVSVPTVSEAAPWDV